MQTLLTDSKPRSILETIVLPLESRGNFFVYGLLPFLGLDFGFLTWYAYLNLHNVKPFTHMPEALFYDAILYGIAGFFCTVITFSGLTVFRYLRDNKFNGVVSDIGIFWLRWQMICDFGRGLGSFTFMLGPLILIFSLSLGFLFGLLIFPAKVILTLRNIFAS